MTYGRHLPDIRESEAQYAREVEPSLQALRKALKDLHDTCYNHHIDIAWSTNPQFMRVQEQIDRLEKQLKAVYHPNRTPTPKRG